jgi:hypothetical protein
MKRIMTKEKWRSGLKEIPKKIQTARILAASAAAVVRDVRQVMRDLDRQREAFEATRERFTDEQE